MNLAGLYARIAPELIDIIELILVIAAVVMIVRGRHGRASAKQASGGFESLENTFGRLARRKLPAVVIVGLLVITFRVATIP